MPRGKGSTGYGATPQTIKSKFLDKTMCQLKVTQAYAKIPPGFDKSKVKKSRLIKLLSKYD